MNSESLRPEDDASRADLSACRVLVVDDATGIRKIIGAYLKSAGIVNVEYANDGHDGLAKVDSFEPDLIILDIMMPEMDGFEVCRRLRGDPRTQHLPILVQTALETPSERTAVFRAGATDLITKPIHGPELVARVRVQLENRQLIRSLENYRSSMETELDLARQMQESLLPHNGVKLRLAGSAGLRVESHFQPSAELGGDMWTIHELGDDRIGVASVDFSGHGVTAALNTFRLHTLMHQMPPPDPDQPGAYLAELNRQLVDLLPVHQFATMFYGVIDTRRGVLTYSGAGAPCPIFGSAGGGLDELDASGLPLGITRRATYSDMCVPFPEGSFLLLYSDALVETADLAGGNLGQAELLEMVRASLDDVEAGSPLSSLLRRFRDNREPLSDDLTMVWLSHEAAVE